MVPLGAGRCWPPITVEYLPLPAWGREVLEHLGPRPEEQRRATQVPTTGSEAVIVHPSEPKTVEKVDDGIGSLLTPEALSVVDNNESITRNDLGCRFCAQVPVPTIDHDNVEALVEKQGSPGVRQMIIPKDGADVGELPALRLDNT